MTRSYTLPMTEHIVDFDGDWQRGLVGVIDAANPDADVLTDRIFADRGVPKIYLQLPAEMDGEHAAAEVIRIGRLCDAFIRAARKAAARRAMRALVPDLGDTLAQPTTGVPATGPQAATSHDAHNDVPKELVFHERLGAGAFAGVWKAHDPHLGRDVAVKIFLPTEVVISDAMDHGRALAKVNHPNVIAVYEVARVRNPENARHIVDAVLMELVSGGSLAERLRGPLLDRAEANQIGTAIVGGVRAIHGSGLAHGDLHEGNVLLDPVVSAKVIDILYRGTLALLPTTTREQHFARDVDSVRGLLGLLLNHSDIPFESAFRFRERVSKSADLTTFLVEFRAALTAADDAQS